MPVEGLQLWSRLQVRCFLHLRLCAQVSDPVAVTMERRESFSVLRRLLRAAAAHDKAPALKALLPLTAPAVELPLSSPEAPPLRTLAIAALRQKGAQAEGPVGGLAAALTGVTELLEANLKRGRRYERKMRDQERQSLRGTPPRSAGTSQNSNLPWFHSRIQAALGKEKDETRRQALADSDTRSLVAQAWAAAGKAPPSHIPHSKPASPDEDDPVAILREMQAVGLSPPRRMVVQALTSLAQSGAPEDYEKALQLLFFLDLRTPHVACTSCVDALVAGCLLTQPPSGGVWRALSVAEALHTSAGLLPSTAVANRLLEVAAGAVDDTLTLQRCKDAMRRFAAAQVPLLSDVSVQLLTAAMRLNDRGTAVWCCRQIRARGGSIPAQLLLELLEWSVADGDSSSSDFLTAELMKDNKGLYLTALNNPSC